jgi:hypothetical protein
MDTHRFTPSRPDGVVCIAGRVNLTGDEVCGYPAGHPIHAEPFRAEETTDAHPAAPDGPLSHFADCPECGAGRGFPCVDIDMHQLPGKRLPYVHTSRALDRPSTPAEVRTGLSDWAAVALDDVATMRRTGIVNATRLDRIERALREGGDR